MKNVSIFIKKEWSNQKRLYINNRGNSDLLIKFDLIFKNA